MKRYLNSTVISCLCGMMMWVGAAFNAYAQYEYRIGKGESSIEPGKHVLSLALAGYGAPRDGRFSLEWVPYLHQEHGADAAAIVANQLFAVREGKLWRSDLTDPNDTPTPVHPNRQFKLVAGYGNTLLAVNAHNELLQAAPPRRKGLKWRQRAVLQQLPRSLDYWNGQFVLLDSSGVLWTADDRRGNLVWKAMGEYNDAIDIMAHGKELYVLSNQHEIRRYRGPDDWLRVAIHNGITYSQNVRRLFASEDGFWAMDRAGVLYQAQHASTGQLSVGALVIQKGGQKVVIVGADVCGFDGSFVNAVKQTIAQRFGIPPEAVMVNASHTHFGPVTQHWPTWGAHCQEPDSMYLTTVVRTGILDAVEQAVGSLQPANLYVGRSEVEIGHNRNLPGTDLPYDKSLDVIRVDYGHLDQDDIVFLAGCHPVFQHAGREGVTLSPNYPGVAREWLSDLATVRSAMFIQGCGGDINPVDADHRLTARKVTTAVIRLLDQGAMQQIEGDLTFFLDTVLFDARPWSIRDIRKFRKAHQGQYGDVGAEKNVRWADLMLQHHANGSMPTTMPVFIQTFNIGNWKLVGVSRETTTEYSLGIKNIWPEKLVSVAGYCNDVSSYLPTSRHIKAGIYEGYDSFFWYGQPNVFPEQVYETIIQSIQTKNR